MSNLAQATRLVPNKRVADEVRAIRDSARGSSVRQPVPVASSSKGPSSSAAAPRPQQTSLPVNAPGMPKPCEFRVLYLDVSRRGLRHMLHALHDIFHAFNLKSGSPWLALARPGSPWLPYQTEHSGQVALSLSQLKLVVCSVLCICLLAAHNASVALCSILGA